MNSADIEAASFKDTLSEPIWLVEKEGVTIIYSGPADQQSEREIYIDSMLFSDELLSTHN
jgi:hypothetical protein